MLAYPKLYLFFCVSFIGFSLTLSLLKVISTPLSKGIGNLSDGKALADVRTGMKNAPTVSRGTISASWHNPIFFLTLDFERSLNLIYWIFSKSYLPPHLAHSDRVTWMRVQFAKKLPSQFPVSETLLL